jgi:hypothetical protein
MYVCSQENLGPEYAAALQEIRDKDRGNNIVFSSRVNCFSVSISEPHKYEIILPNAWRSICQSSEEFYDSFSKV